MRAWIAWFLQNFKIKTWEFCNAPKFNLLQRQRQTESTCDKPRWCGGLLCDQGMRAIGGKLTRLRNWFYGSLASWIQQDKSSYKIWLINPKTALLHSNFDCGKSGFAHIFCVCSPSTFKVTQIQTQKNQSKYKTLFSVDRSTYMGMAGWVTWASDS